MSIALRLFDPADVVSDHLPGSLRLRDYYTAYVLPELEDEELKPRSLKEDLTAIGHWERLTTDPPVEQINRDDLKALRDGLKERGVAAETINKTWRELAGILRFAVDEDHLIALPKIGRRRKKKLVKSRPKVQREMITNEELTALWNGCSAATYPIEPDVVRLWKVAIILFYTYGARTLDMLIALRWENIQFKDRLLKFEAMKTRKLQGLPLTDVVIAQLQTIQGDSKKYDRVFRGFNSIGSHLKRLRKWKRGYRTTWRNEILPAAGLDGLLFKHFRQSVVTRYNGIEPGLGNWIAGHYMPGVSAESYDLPTLRVREAIESSPVPDCFHDLS